MKLQRLLSLVRQAVDDYALIDDQDHIAVGVSGGKDSLALLYALHDLLRRLSGSSHDNPHRDRENRF